MAADPNRQAEFWNALAAGLDIVAAEGSGDSGDVEGLYALADDNLRLHLLAVSGRIHCRLLIREGYGRIGPQALLSFDPLSTSADGGAPYYDAAFGQFGWRWALPEPDRDAGHDLAKSVRLKIAWFSSMMLAGAKA